MTGLLERLRAFFGDSRPPHVVPDTDLCLKVLPQVSPSERAAHCSRLIESGDPALRARFHNARGLAYRDLGRNAEARTEYDRAIALDGSNEVFFLNRATIADELGDPLTALADLDRALAIDPHYARAYEDKADILSNLGRARDALAAIDDALSTVKPTVYRLYRRGAILMELARYREAIESLTHALDREPGDARALERRATCFLMQDEPERAIVDLDRALETKPGSQRIEAALGSAWTTIDPDRALRHYAAALTIDPDDAPTLNNRSNLLSELGDQAAADADLDRAIALAPDEPVFRQNRAVNHLEAGRLAEAEADLAHGLAADRDDPAMLALLARIALIRGDEPRASNLLARALAREPHHADAFCVCGWQHLLGDRLAEARIAFDRALDQRPGAHLGTLSRRVRWTALYGRGLARRRAGDLAGGTADLEAARAIRPDAERVVATWGVALQGPPTGGLN